MIRLYTLGTTQLLSASGGTFSRVLTQPKRLALLSYLTVADPGAFQRRDKLLSLFSPEHDEQHARWALNQAVHLLRSQLGASVIPSRGADAIAVSRDRLWCDAVAFQEACVSEDWSAAVQLYRGEFLDGLHVAGCDELAQWIDAQRARLRQLAAHATWSLVAGLEARGALREAVERARTGVRLAPEDEPGVRRLIALLDACGHRAAAVQTYEEHVKWLSANLEVEPAPETVATIDAVKARSSATPVPTPSAAGESIGHVAEHAARHKNRDAYARHNGLRWVGLAAAALGTIVVLGMTAFWIRGEAAPSSSTPAVRSIAVLPLNNQMQDTTQDYFVAGMHEALITELSKIAALKVISRTSTLRYRQTDKPLSQVARELNVDGVIEGSVLREGEHVRIAVHLIHGPTDRHLWARTFERELRNVLALQSDVASAIADEIRINLRPQERRALKSARSVDPEAHQTYLKGRHHLGKGTLGGFENARDYFRQGLDLDPSYAPAYVGLADAYNRFAIQSHQRPTEVYPLAKVALVRALELDETLAEAHALLGVVKFRFEWNWEGAERDLKRALELDPNSTRAHLGYGTYLLMTGRQEEALAHSAKFQELDPLSAFASQNLAWHLYYNRRYDDAITRLRYALQLEPGSGVAYALLAQNYAAKAMYVPAIAACDTAVGLTRNDNGVLSMCGTVYVESGRPREAVALFDKLQLRSSSGDYVDAYHVASLAAAIYTSSTGSDRIQQWLARAYEERSANLCAAKVDPAFRGVSDHPRFQELLRRMDFPSE